MVVNSMDYSGKDTVIDVIRTEHSKFFDIVNDPKNWYVQTRCTEWEVRDIDGHMIDVTEGYLTGWDMARKGEAGNALGLEIMSDRLNEHAQAFRSLSRHAPFRRREVSGRLYRTRQHALLYHVDGLRLINESLQPIRQEG